MSFVAFNRQSCPRNHYTCRPVLLSLQCTADQRRVKRVNELCIWVVCLASAAHNIKIAATLVRPIYWRYRSVWFIPWISDIRPGAGLSRGDRILTTGRFGHVRWLARAFFFGLYRTTLRYGWPPVINQRSLDKELNIQCSYDLKVMRWFDLSCRSTEITDDVTLVMECCKDVSR